MDYDDYKEDFEDDDEEEEDDESDLSKKTAFEEFYELNADLFPEEFKDVMDRFLEHKRYFFEIEPQFTETVDEPLTRLMKQQYPCLQGITDPGVLQIIHDINDMVATEMIGPVRFTLEDIRNGVNFREKYPKFERWKEFYGKPADVDKVSEIPRYVWFKGTDEEWEAYKAKEIEEMRQYNRWCQSRLQAFYDIVQPKVFEVFPDLINIEGDAWVIYAMHIRDAYEQWMSRCESLEIIITHQMPPESFHWDGDKYQEAMMNADPALQKKYDEDRQARIKAHP